jgi:PAS domain S-box-containing protein
MIKHDPIAAVRSYFRRDVLVRPALVLGTVGLAMVVRLWLDPLLPKQSGLFFWAAILIGAWVGGLVPSLVGQTLILAAQYQWYTPLPSPWRPTTADIFFILTYYVLGSTLAVASDLRRRAQQRARIQQAEAIYQREQLRATLSCMADGVLVTDERGCLTLMNPPAEVMTGWTLAESRGKRLPEFFAVHREDQQPVVEDPFDWVLHDGQVVHSALHLLLTSRAGKIIPISYSAAPIRDAAGQITGGVLVFRDESERRRNEQALRNADRQKDEFLATLAHELRNPLAPICMGLDLLRMSRHDPAASAEVFDMMARQSQHMVRLIDDLMDVSRITRGKLELRKQQIALDEVVQNAVDANRPNIDQARLRLTVKLPGEPILLFADPNRLTQVFSNLLNNAAKFTPADGYIELSAERKGGNIVVTVADGGIGIPADQRDFIFEMFTQIDRGAESMPVGLGIGLTLVKRLVEMHGGAISVESDGQNLGSRFHVQLPMVPHTPGDVTSNGSTGGSFRAAKRRVLIVDDNADALASLSLVVRALGSETFDARDGLEAVESASNLRPDVILMDIGMPKLNGYDAARRIRQEPWGHEVLMVATTGWGKEEDRRRSKEAGFDLHLVKPIDISAVQELLESPARKPTHPPLPVA